MNWRALLDHLYLTRTRAVALGFTHEGALFGVPAWLIEQSEEEVLGCPKVPVLQLWTAAADCLYELATLFMRGDSVLVAPIRITGPIRAGVAP